MLSFNQEVGDFTITHSVLLKVKSMIAAVLKKVKDVNPVCISEYMKNLITTMLLTSIKFNDELKCNFNINILFRCLSKSYLDASSYFISNCAAVMLKDIASPRTLKQCIVDVYQHDFILDDALIKKDKNRNISLQQAKTQLAFNLTEDVILLSDSEEFLMFIKYILITGSISMTISVMPNLRVKLQQAAKKKLKFNRGLPVVGLLIDA